MTEIVSKPNHGDRLINKDEGTATATLQLYLDDIMQRLNLVVGDRVSLTSYTVVGVPVPTAGIGMIFVSDEIGGATMAFSDGTNWLRCKDLAIIS